ncbi:PrgI family protein [Candidatus Saccharibacteria bacterium]|nr:PrgI family protein [Candidatus Saccharibacteria bacterium]MBQ6461559.1 PrgI family protein [Candidatus Saccharibacteria bacterium]
MAQYKVPQDVEADDKLIGPFSFRQFVYLLIAAGLIALAVGLFQIFPILAILPLPPVLLFLALALPLKKDQPMETYLAALVSYYLKPRTKKWTPGQRESTILITAPKIVEDVRTRDISEEEATHRLSFLADIVDTQGYAIRGVTNSNMRDDLAAEANAMNDMFDNYKAMNLGRAAAQEKAERHEEAIREMREAINRNESFIGLNKNIQTEQNLTSGAKMVEPVREEEQVESVIVMPDVNTSLRKNTENVNVKPVKNSIIELANNSDYSIQTIAKEANRINRKDEGEVYIALH